MRPLRILLGLASGGKPTKPFLDALAKLRLPPQVEALERSVAFGNFIPAQRELVLQDAIDGGFDYLLFVDDDVVLPPDALELLLATAQDDPLSAVVGALYYDREGLKPIAVGGWQSGKTTAAYVPAFGPTSSDPVDGVGFGCALLSVAVARTLSAPYFPVHILIEKRARIVRQCDEDYRYCERVRRAGFTVRLDARVRCLHYDRAKDAFFPAAPEPASATAVRRMVVAGNGKPELVAYDPTAPQAGETQRAADVVYVTVD